MKKLLTFLLATAVLFTTACTNSDDSVNSNTDPTPEKPKTEIKLETTSLDFSTEGGRDEISFTSTEAWTAEVINSRADSWLSVSPTSGNAGDATISIKAKNNDTTDERSASVRIKAGSAQKIINVTQKQKDALTITSSKFEITAEGGEVTIEVKANIKFEYTIDEFAKDWIKYEGTRAMKTSTLSFSVAENEDSEKREAKIYITSGDLNEVITIYQEGSKPSIVISQNEYIVSSDGGTIDVDVKSNVDVAVEAPADVDWISENTTRTFSTNTYRFDIQPNDSHDNRSAEIKFTNKENNLSDVVKITQMQLDAIVLAKSEYEFDFEGGNLDFDILTNVDINVSISNDAQNWIIQNTTRAMHTHKLSFTIDVSKNMVDREGSITISGGDAKQTITVKQHNRKVTLELEREALIALYKATDGDNWINNENWCSNKPVYQWYGVKTKWIEYENKTGIVTELNLSENNLKGSIPESIGNLRYLSRLALDNNFLTGDLPKSIENLEKLTYIDLRYNQLTNIPIEVGNLVNLRYLDLFDNKLSNIPSEIGNLINLQWLNLGANQLSGNIPSEIINLESLRNLYLQGNKFTGEIPPEIENLKNLQRLVLSNNELTGKIPPEIGNLENLQELSLSSNELTGEIPPEIGNLKNLGSLCLDWNKLTGHIPTQLGNLVNLNTFIINANYLIGKVPESIMQLDCWAVWWSLIIGQKGEGISNEGLTIPAPKFNTTTSDGKEIDDSIYAKNEYTVLYHYYNWCSFANDFTPKLVQLYAGYKDKGLNVVALSDTGTNESHKKYATKFNTQWPYLTNCMFKSFTSYRSASPNVNIVDKNGYVVFNSVSNDYNDIDEFLLEKLGEPSNNENIETDLYESSDYSHDGVVKILQEATKGYGIDIILMGDAYSDRLINDGTYDNVMNIAMEKLFTEEPYKSFRDYFNVYSVKAVSKNEIYTEVSSTAFAGYFEGGTLTGGHNQTVLSYAQKAITEERMDEALIIVIMNSKQVGGTCYFSSPTVNNDWGKGVSISYCTVGQDENQLAQTLLHEAGGHGFAKLADEYVDIMETFPETWVNAYKTQQAMWGWHKNIDFTSNLSTIRWNHFINDPRYTNEGLGAYEGGLRYITGAWRPTQNSIMRYNTDGFNAPSREAIYYRIHKLAYGADWEYNYEAFADWDAKNRKGESTRGVPYSTEKPENFVPNHPPVIIPHTWREMMQK